jgi:hypothetical protein
VVFQRSGARAGLRRFAISRYCPGRAALAEPAATGREHPVVVVASEALGYVSGPANFTIMTSST